MADELRIGSQMGHQQLMVAISTYIRREVRLDVRVLIGIIAMSLNHCPIVFDRVYPYLHAGVRAQPACRIAVA